MTDDILTQNTTATQGTWQALANTGSMLGLSSSWPWWRAERGHGRSADAWKQTRPVFRDGGATRSFPADPVASLWPSAHRKRPQNAQNAIQARNRAFSWLFLQQRLLRSCLVSSGAFSLQITAKNGRSGCAGQRQDLFRPPNRWCSCSLYPKYTKTQSRPAIWLYCVPKAPGFGSWSA
ncbi:hypothetical protein KL925_001424 [Ogataea polymorpha]|nr:hypothetical protein KL936_001424 [Ogataea polymorpha]KAG7928124.1 hypothetical protein KL925_001424 [Ogataea polymorpha]